MIAPQEGMPMTGVQTPPAPKPGRNTDWKSIVGLVLGTLGTLPVLIYPIFCLAPLVGVVAGVWVLIDIRRGARSNKLLAIISIVYGVLLALACAVGVLMLYGLGTWLEHNDFG